MAMSWQRPPAANLVITIDDFVMLGTTVPEPRTDGRVFVCSAGVSTQLGALLRVYPLARSDIPHRWHTYEVSLQRPSAGHDSRHESWQPAADRSPSAHGTINSAFAERGATEVRREARSQLVDRFVVPSIEDANSRRLSLAIIRPIGAPEIMWEHRPDDPESPQLALFDDGPQIPEGSKRFEWVPRLRFADGRGEHRLMIRDWGSFELMRKRGYEYAQSNLANALHLDDDSVLLVGNLNNQRNAWLVISVLNGVVGQRTLFESEPPPDRSPYRTPTSS
jgi:hypothetical protein